MLPRREKLKLVIEWLLSLCRKKIKGCVLNIISCCDFKAFIARLRVHRRNPGFYGVSFSSLCDWSSKLALLSQPIRCWTEINHDLVAGVFPPLGLLGCCCCEFSFTFLLNGYRVTLALVLRNSIEKRSLSIQQSNTRIKIRKRHETSYLRSGKTFLNPVACILSGY